jgi:hypothetical protein
MWHWLRRQFTARGRVINARLRAAYKLRVKADRAEAARASTRTRTALKQRPFRQVKEEA